MGKKVISGSLMAAVFLIGSVIPAAAGVSIVNKDLGGQKLKVKLFGFSQITAQSGNGLASSATDKRDGLRFGADRVRLGYKLSMNKVFSKLQIDFVKSDGTHKQGQLSNVIKDADVGYKFNKTFSVKVGEFKTPVGMDFNTSGAKLDITKRGMEKALVLERSLGAMLSGRKIGGIFGYDIGIFNPATRASKVVDNASSNKIYGVAGHDYAYAVRGMADWQSLHAELSYGVSEEAAGDSYAVGTADKDYSVWDVAASYKLDVMTLKGEYIAGSNIKGVNNSDESVWYLHAGYRFLPMLEGVIRHYQAHYSPVTGVSTDLGNTYLGLNIFLNPKVKHAARIQLNYVIASGDDGFGGTYGGITKGYMNNVILAQFQLAF
ncbi:MAG: porin [Deltaproteobacteria bacterium]|nr:porin [Deltaproteobacteria bacterium]